MVKARDADPSNLEVLLALGVSHTNGLSHPFLSSPQLAGYISYEWTFFNHFLSATW
jgi:hypothetical protein